MPIVKIPKHWVVSEDETTIALEIPESAIASWQKDYRPIADARGLLADRKDELLTYSREIRREWE